MFRSSIIPRANDSYDFSKPHIHSVSIASKPMSHFRSNVNTCRGYVDCIVLLERYDYNSNRWIVLAQYESHDRIADRKRDYYGNFV